MLGVAAIEAVLLLLLVFSSNSALSSSLDEELDKRAQTSLSLLLATATDPILTDDVATLEDLAEKSLQIPDVIRIEITSPEGMLAEAGRGAASGEDVYTDAIPLKVGDRTQATIELTFSRASAMAARQDLQRQNLVIAASEMLLVALFSILLGRYLTRNLKQLQRATSAIAAGDLGVVVPARGSDELASVSRSFNRMSQELLRSHVEQAASERRLASVLDGIRDGVCLIDSRNRVRYHNPTAASHLEILAPEWRPNSALTHLASRPLETLHEDGAAQARVEVETDSEHLCFDVRLSANDSATTEPRSVAERILTIRDVTAQQAQEAYDRRQEQLAVVGQLAAGLAHDFNNILGVIIGVAELNLMDERELAPQLTKDFRTIHEQATRSSQLIRQMLDFSRGGEVEVAVIDVRAALSSMVALLQRTIPSAVKLECEVGDVPLHAAFDETKFQQVVANLVINASASMPDGGTIRVTARRHEGSGLRPNTAPETFERWIVVQVADSGHGIPRKDLARIFEPFFTTKDKSAGAGLGLAQVYGILQRQGGDIHVDSTVGKGTCFSLFVQPEDREQPAPPPPSPEVAAQPEKGADAAVILVVEDQDGMRATVAAMLSRLGYGTCLACSGEEGLELFERERDRISAVLTDAVMPGIDGFEMTSKLRGSGCEVPIVMMSGYFEREAATALQAESNIDAFVSKPVGLQDLSATLGRLLSADGRSRSS